MSAPTTTAAAPGGPPPAWLDLITAIALLAKHPSSEINPVHCSHETLFVMADPALFTVEELARLDELGFNPDPDGSCFQSVRFGSA